jgi:hypothetical protein
MMDLTITNVLNSNELEQRFADARKQNSKLNKVCNDCNLQTFKDFYADKNTSGMWIDLFKIMKINRYPETMFFQDLRKQNENCEYCKHFQRGSVLPNITN